MRIGNGPAWLAILAAAAACSETNSSGQIDCIADEGCPAGQLCNRMTNVCYAPQGSTPPDGGSGDGPTGDGGAIDQGLPLENGARGTFTCARFATYPDASEVPAAKLDGEIAYGGKRYKFFTDAACHETQDYFACQLNAYDAGLQTEVPLTFFMRKQNLVEGKTYEAPREIYGFLNHGTPGLAMLEQHRKAVVWGGTVRFTKVAADEVSGEIDVTFEKIVPKPFGSICRLAMECGKGCNPIDGNERASPDCDVGAGCLPLYDGTARGFCFSFCDTDADCHKWYPNTQCYSKAPEVCLRQCKTDDECEAPTRCSPNGDGCISW